MTDADTGAFSLTIAQDATDESTMVTTEHETPAAKAAEGVDAATQEAAEAVEQLLDDAGHAIDNALDSALGLGNAERLHEEMGHLNEPHTKSGMPQLAMDTYASQIFWLVISFAVLYAFMSRMIIPRIQHVLEDRASRINHDIGRAEQMQTEAVEAKAQFEHAMIEAKEKTADIITKAQASIAKKLSTEQHTLDEKLNSEFSVAEARIDQAKAEAYTHIASAMTDVVATIVESLTHKETDPKKVEKVVQTLINARQG